MVVSKGTQPVLALIISAEGMNMICDNRLVLTALSKDVLECCSQRVFLLFRMWSNSGAEQDLYRHNRDPLLLPRTEAFLARIGEELVPDKVRQRNKVSALPKWLPLDAQSLCESVHRCPACRHWHVVN